MEDLNYRGQGTIHLSGEEVYAHSDITYPYIIAINKTNEIIRLSRYSKDAPEPDDKQVKMIEPGLCNYIAAGITDRCFFYIDGSGDVEIVYRYNEKVAQEFVDAYNQGMIQSRRYQPNLLINPDFRINQRGKTEYTAAGFAVDGWALQPNCNVTVNDNGVHLECLERNNNGFYQKYDKALSEYTVTYSIKASGSGTLRFGIWETNIKEVALTDKPTVYTSTFICGSDTAFGMWLSAAGEYADIEWAKVECGSEATSFSPPEMSEELAKCRRLYQRLSFFRIPMAYHNSSTMTWFVPFTPMKSQPVVTINSGGLYIDGMPAGDNPTDFSVAWAAGTDGVSASGCIRVNCSYNSEWDSYISSGSWNAPLSANSADAGLILEVQPE